MHRWSPHCALGWLQAELEEAEQEAEVRGGGSWAPRGHSCRVSGKQLFWEEAPCAGMLTFAPLLPAHGCLLCLLPR